MVIRTVNVGIKSDQKEEIDKIINKSEDKYKSINEFVQNAIDQFVLKHRSKEDLKEVEDVDGILYKLKEIVESILRDELEDKITITTEIAEKIQELLKKIKKFQISFRWDDETQQLISAIRLKDSLNLLKEEIKEAKGKSLNKYVDKLDKLREDFVDSIKSLRIKPGK